MNDSFPPVIDGVANTVENYARNLHDDGNTVSIVTPNYPDNNDDSFPYPILRYPSLDTTKLLGYRAGYPFSPETLKTLRELKPDIIHSHCPIVSNYMARSLRGVIKVPVIFTYHTKFDIEIRKFIKGKLLQETAIKLLVQNIEACDEVWVVSRGAGENLRSLGYEGKYIIMPNGVDYPQGRADEKIISDTRKKYSLETELPIFLFVGRMCWYKGIKITMDALAKYKADGNDFRMVFVGGGNDLEEMKEYAADNGIFDNCIFTGPIGDREIIRAFYCIADLFLFPSTFDTNGLVVREAASCSLASILIKGSCAAEDITDGHTGFLINETAVSMYKCLKSLTENRDRIKTVGKNAQSEIYLSWDSAIENAKIEYADVVERYKAGLFPPHNEFSDGFFKLSGEMMKALSKARPIHFDKYDK